jgi:1,4-alpha-glucan branching enzyme
MLYLDYSRKEGEWEPNIYGGRENLDTISFLKNLMKQFIQIMKVFKPLLRKALFPMVSRPTSMGGLGFEMDDGLDA